MSENIYGHRLYDAMCCLANTECQVVYLEDPDWHLLELAILEKRSYGMGKSEIELVELMPQKISCLKHNSGMLIHFAYSVRSNKPQTKGTK